VREKGPAGEFQAIEIDGYDPVNKTFTWDVYVDNGETASGVSTFSSGTTVTYSGKSVVGGKQYLDRGTDVFAPDLLSFTEKDEASTDGKTWMTTWEYKATKSQPAPKK
jgi:hypothetical protein